MIKKRSVPEKISSVSDCVHMSLTAFRVLSYRITDIVTTMLGITIVDMDLLRFVRHCVCAGGLRSGALFVLSLSLVLPAAGAVTCVGGSGFTLRVLCGGFGLLKKSANNWILCVGSRRVWTVIGARGKCQEYALSDGVNKKEPGGKF